MPSLKPTTYFDVAKPLPVIEKLIYIHACHLLYKEPWAKPLVALAREAALWADPTGSIISQACAHASLKEIIKLDLIRKKRKNACAYTLT